MKKFFQRPVMAAMSAAFVLTMAGCAQQPRSLYQWGSYQQQVYARFNSKTTPQEQVQALEADLARIQAAGQAPAPGMRAHLGMLYAEMGQKDSARKMLEAEKAQFPESTRYMDFLLSRINNP
jgi:hypothetical protein